MTGKDEHGPKRREKDEHGPKRQEKDEHGPKWTEKDPRRFSSVEATQWFFQFRDSVYQSGPMGCIKTRDGGCGHPGVFF